MKMKNDYKKRNQVFAGSATVFLPAAAVRVATLSPHPITTIYSILALVLLLLAESKSFRERNRAAKRLFLFTQFLLRFQSPSPGLIKIS
jgi:hypothetical protein